MTSHTKIYKTPLAEHLESVHVAAGDVVITQREAGDGLFLVVSGRLRVSVVADGTERVLHDLARGADRRGDRVAQQPPPVGDGSRRPLQRTAAVASVLVPFPSRANPAVLREMTRLLIERLLAVDRPQARPTSGRAIAVAAAGGGTGAAPMVAEWLAGQLARAGSVFRLDADVVARYLSPGAVQRPPGDSGRAELTGWLNAVERGNDRVIYLADAEDTAWSRLCLSQSDVVLLTAAAGGRAFAWALLKSARGLLTLSAVSLSLCIPADPRHGQVAARQARGRLPPPAL